MFTASVLTVSDKGFSGQREDTAGPLVCQLLADAGYNVVHTQIVPDEQELIQSALIRLSDELGVHLVITTGGTGFSPRDVTPEATAAVCQKMAPGIPEAMRTASSRVTDRAMLSRAACGIRGRTLILNLPGSPKAVRENLAPVLGALEHGLHMLLGTQGECASQPENRP